MYVSVNVNDQNLSFLPRVYLHASSRICFISIRFFSRAVFPVFFVSLLFGNSSATYLLACKDKLLTPAMTRCIDAPSRPSVCAEVS